MKKIILFALIVFGGINSIYSQYECTCKSDSFAKKDSINRITKITPRDEHMYVIFTSKEYDPTDPFKIKEGVSRVTSCEPKWQTSSVMYFFESRSKNLYIEFAHWNFDIEYLEKIRSIKPDDKMNVVPVSKKFLSGIKPIDLDKKGPSMTKKKVLALKERLVGKVVWVIDRRDITKDSVKLIQTKVF